DFDLLVGAAGSETQLVLTSVYLDLAALELLPGSTLALLAADPRVAGVAPIAFGDVVAGYPVIGTSLAFATRWGRLSPSEGRLFAAPDEALVGFDVRLRLGDEITPAHATAGRGWPPSVAEEARHRHEGVHYDVVGRLPRLGSPYDRAILVPVETVWATHGLGTGHAEAGRIGPPWDGPTVPGVPAIVVKPRSVADAYALRAAYRRAGQLALFPAEVLVSLYRRLGDVRDVLTIASWLNAALILSALTLLLATLTGLRRRRYALLRALGAPATYVFAVVWLGAAALVASGGALGLAIGWGAAVAVSRALEDRTGLALAFRPAWSDLGLVLGLVALGSALALVPAALAYRRPPGAELRA
ncbi:MAG: FtsX-like permease family protein, partial [Methylobacteriaceae bacterium]|nr:FtsX-like permease family protein [Methylobacteriaceae bacterium]